DVVIGGHFQRFLGPLDVFGVVLQIAVGGGQRVGGGEQGLLLEELFAVFDDFGLILEIVIRFRGGGNEQAVGAFGVDFHWLFELRPLFIQVLQHLTREGEKFLRQIDDRLIVLGFEIFPVNLVDRRHGIALQGDGFSVLNIIDQPVRLLDGVLLLFIDFLEFRIFLFVVVFVVLFLGGLRCHDLRRPCPGCRRRLLRIFFTPRLGILLLGIGPRQP